MVEETTTSDENKTEQSGNKILDLFNKVEGEAKSGDFQFLQDGENSINFSKLTDLEIITEDFQKKDGSVNKVRKLIVTIEGQEKPWKMPISIYGKLKPFISRGMNKLIILKQGEGLDTKYTVLPEIPPAK